MQMKIAAGRDQIGCWVLFEDFEISKMEPMAGYPGYFAFKGERFWHGLTFFVTGRMSLEEREKGEVRASSLCTWVSEDIAEMDYDARVSGEVI